MTFEPLTPERRRGMTRQHLLEAAAIVFARNGFHGSTLDEVAATAGFTKGAVYSNFKSKDDLFLALLDDRIEREFTAIQAELAGGPRPREEELPRMRDLVREQMWDDDDWIALYLEFVLYALRNPEARAKLASRARKSRDAVERIIEMEYARIGATPELPTRSIATISMALFEGLGLTRLIDPFAVSEETLHTTLDFMYSAIGVDDETDSPEQPTKPD